MGGCVSECTRGLSSLLTDTDVDSLERGDTMDIPGFSAIANLGSGGFAVVWQAQDLSTGDHCAVKCVSKRRCPPITLAPEVDAMRALQHENVLGLAQHFEDEHRSYLVLELCLGGDLFDRLDDGHLSETESALVLFQILSALEHMHELRIAHRDLKPENVLLVRHGPIQGNAVKLADFGMAVEVRAGAPRSLVGSAGTPLYAAPEVFQGCYGVECDLWSAGVLLFVCLSGSEPFESYASARSPQPRYCFGVERWNAVSKPAKFLVTSLLEPQATRRATASAALLSAWFRARGCCLDSDSEASTEAPGAERLRACSDMSASETDA